MIDITSNSLISIILCCILPSKEIDMRPAAIKSFLLGSVTLFAVVLLMIIVGTIASLFGAGDSFYCGVFCDAGKVIMILAIFTITIQSFRAFHSN